MKKLCVTLLFTALGALACSSENSIKGAADGGTASGSCTAPPTLTQAEYCSSCTVSPKAQTQACKAPKVLNACCVFLPAPAGAITRGLNLRRYSGTDPTVNLGCLAAPAPLGTPQPVTVRGHVRLFSSGNDSENVRIEFFKEGPDGSLGDRVGEAVVTTADDTKNPPLVETWLKNCPANGCNLRAFEYKGVPTETPLIIKTSDAGAGSQWAALYDYNVYFANTSVQDGAVTYDPSVVAATDLNTVASSAGGFTISPSKGLLAGEVHDCGDVRLSQAFVDTDVAHEGEVFYFGDTESDPLPDKSRAKLGTSSLGLFGMLNLEAGTPIRISAAGQHEGKTVLLGTYTVQVFPNAVTALSLRGRRPWQK